MGNRDKPVMSFCISRQIMLELISSQSHSNSNDVSTQGPRSVELVIISTGSELIGTSGSVETCD